MKKACSNPNHEGENPIDISYFAYNSRTRCKRQSWCKSCMAQAQRKWYAENREAKNAQLRQQRRDNKENNTIEIRRRVVLLTSNDTSIKEI